MNPLTMTGSSGRYLVADNGTGTHYATIKLLSYNRPTYRWNVKFHVPTAEREYITDTSFSTPTLKAAVALVAKTYHTEVK